MTTTLHSIESAAKILNISKWQIYRFVENKSISHIRIGRTIRISEKQILEFITKNEVICTK